MISLALWIVVGLNASITLWHLWSIRRLHQQEREVLATLEMYQGIRQSEMLDLLAYRDGDGWVISDPSRMGGYHRVEIGRN